MSLDLTKLESALADVQKLEAAIKAAVDKSGPGGSTVTLPELFAIVGKAAKVAADVAAIAG